eukprot:contig_17571_g4301
MVYKGAPGAAGWVGAQPNIRSTAAPPGRAPHAPAVFPTQPPRTTRRSSSLPIPSPAHFSADLHHSPATMVSVRAVVAAALLAVAAVAASVPSAAASSYSSAVCVTTTTKCCYTPFLCGVVIKKSVSKTAVDCSQKVIKKVEVPCHYGGGGGGIHIISHRTYVAPHYVRKCYAQQHVTVSKTCYKDIVVLQYFAKICYKEACSHPSVSGSKPSDGVVGSGVSESAVHGDPAGYFKKLYGFY